MKNFCKIASNRIRHAKTTCGTMGRLGTAGRLVGLTSLVCTSIVAHPAFAQVSDYNGASAAANKAFTKQVLKTHKPTKSASGRANAPKRGQAVQIPTDTPVASRAPIPACSGESAAALNKKYNLKGWVISPPSFADSLTQDDNCWRTNLAKAGFGLLIYDVSLLQTNMLNHYVPASNLQKYVGDRTTAAQHPDIFLFYDLSRYGIPDGQLQFGALEETSTWVGYVPNDLTLAQLAYYQSAFNHTLEFNVGYIGLDKQFVGTQVGGNIANVLGPGSTIHAIEGGSQDGAPTPAAILRWNIADHIYDKASVSKSIATTTLGGPVGNLLAQHYSNPTGFNFSNTPVIFGVKYPTSRELFIDELGYKNEADIGSPYTWVRVTGYYNTTLYENLQFTSKQTTNDAVQLYIDRQLWQFEPSSSATAYKGLYVGGTAAWAKPEASSITQDFQARLYSYGAFNRPRDQISLTWEHQVYSPYVANPVDASATCMSGLECVRHATNQYTLIYNASIIPGWHVLFGAAYVDHPSSTWSPNAVAYGSAAAPVVPQYNINHALNFLAGMFINL